MGAEGVGRPGGEGECCNPRADEIGKSTGRCIIGSSHQGDGEKERRSYLRFAGLRSLCSRGLPT